MQHQRQIIEIRSQILQTVEGQRWLRLEFVRAVAGADGDGEGIDAGVVDEFRRLFRVGQGRGNIRIGIAVNIAKAPFDDDAVIVSVGHNLFRQLHVVCVGQARAVNHHRSEARVNTGDTGVVIRSVVEVKADVDVGGFDSSFNHF